MEFVRRFAKGLKSRDGFGTAALMLVAIVYVIASVHLMAPSYLVNDNIAIMDYAIQGWPIDFIGILLTRFLHFAYGTLPSIPWYGLSLYVLHCLSVFLWLRLIWRAFRPWWLASMISAIFLLYYFFFLIFLDYTSTGAMLCMVALGWVSLDVLERRSGYGRFVLPGLVFMLGMVARPQAVLGAMAYGFPVVCIVAFWRLETCARENQPDLNRLSILKAMPYGLPVVLMYLYALPRRHELKRLGLIALVFLLLPALNLVGDTLYRQYTVTPQQTRFESFNTIRGRLHGLPDSRQWQLINDPPAQDAAHLSREQTSTFFNWRFLDERVYTAPALEALLKMLPPPEHPYADFIREFRSRIDAVPELLLLLCCVTFFLLIVPKSPGIGVAGMLLPLYALGFAALFSVFVGFSPRTEIPFAFGFGFLSLVIAGFLVKQSGGDWRPRYLVFAAVACVLGLVGGFKAFTGTQLKELNTRLEAARTEQMLEVLNSDYAGTVIMLDPLSGFTPYVLSPFDVISLRFHPIELGWSTFSPRFYQQIKYLGIDHGYELMDALIDRGDAYALGTGWWAYTMLDDLNKHYMRPIKLERVREFYPDGDLFRYVLAGKSDGVADKSSGAAKRR